jgi:hypothetical protein
MLIKSVKGVVRGGRVEPTETLDAADGTEVTINVPLKPPTSGGRMMTYGMFSGPPFSTEEDFKAAEWQGESEFWEADRDARD